MSNSIKDKLITVTGILVYLSFAIYVVYLFKIYNSSPESYTDVILSLKPVAVFMGVIAVIDAMLITCFEKKYTLLLIFAIVLLPFYPVYRDRVMRGRFNIGILLTVLFFIGLGAVIIFAGKTASSYGQLTINVTDKETLDEAMALMDQEVENGKTYSDLLIKKRKFSPEDATMTKKGNIITLKVSGRGYVDVNEREGYFEISSLKNATSTTLTFTKSGTGDYKLKGVEVGGRKLSEKETESYYASITQ